MHILTFNDCENKEHFLAVTPDMIFFLGNVDFEYMMKIDKHYDCPKLYVPGRFDLPRDLERSSILNVDRKMIEMNGVSFAGIGGGPVYKERIPGRHSNQRSEDEVRAFLDSIHSVDFFLASATIAGNPVRIDEHRGFECYAEFIDRIQPRYSFHGYARFPYEQGIEYHGETGCRYTLEI